MEKQDAFFLGKNPQIHVSSFDVAGNNTCNTRKSDNYGELAPDSDSSFEDWSKYFGYSNPIIQTDDRQAFGATAKRIDTSQGRALSEY